MGRTCLGCRLGRFAAERHWRSLTPRHAVLEWVWGSAPGSGGGPVLDGSCRKSQNGRCWFGATGNFRGQNKRKRAENPPKSRKYIDRNRHRPYNKKRRELLPAGVCCRQAVSHSLFTLCRKGVMRMGHKRGTKALRFTICLVIVLAVAIALAPKAC